ncbi:MAG: hypothetical protein U0359_14365 [Byssovorax sp.]
MNENALEELLAIVRRDLGAEEARVLARGEQLPAGTPHIKCDLPGGRTLVALYPALPVDAAARTQRLAMLASSFDELLAAPPAETERGSRPPPGRSLHDELRALGERAGAVDAVVIDTHSPVVWGTAGEDRATPSLSRVPQGFALSGRSKKAGGETGVARLSRQYGLASIEGLWMDPAATAVVPRALCEKHRLVPVARQGNTLVLGMADPENLDAIRDVVLATGLEIDPVVAGPSLLSLYERSHPPAPDLDVDEILAALPAEERAARAEMAAEARSSWARHLASRRAITDVRALPQMATLHRGGHLHVSFQGEGFGFIAQSFAAIYVLILVFDAPVDELRAKRAIVHALPAIEKLVLALPPLDPDPIQAGAMAMRPRKRNA